MKRIYGHIGWYDDDASEFVNGRAICGKQVSRKRSAPLLVCGKCAQGLVSYVPQAQRLFTYRQWSR
ncbi:hypothetical protein MHY85_05305 [Cellulomonas sp. ACRRI]|uniref:hypothetical protein n=1 Tax=Cellulomonas sp. ACRRI TaxID=2918188 RepID=UPI001EF33F76|nr:hypothetical protein [Cellulomonas sp. ACRRI]MCG7285393.1 hypothetical protein [Cellulomonas sp. ACRRI]